MGRTWSLLGHSWGALDRSWDTLRLSWGRSWVHLAALGPLLGCSWSHLGPQDRPRPPREATRVTQDRPQRPLDRPKTGPRPRMEAPRPPPGAAQDQGLDVIGRSPAILQDDFEIVGHRKISTTLQNDFESIRHRKTAHIGPGHLQRCMNLRTDRQSKHIVEQKYFEKHAVRQHGADRPATLSTNIIALKR